MSVFDMGKNMDHREAEFLELPAGNTNIGVSAVTVLKDWGISQHCLDCNEKILEERELGGMQALVSLRITREGVRCVECKS